MPLLKFRNFTAAARKPNLVLFGMYRAEDLSSLDVIESAVDTPVTVTGTQNGVNVSFTISAPVSSLYRNGVRQTTPGDYSVTGNSLVWVIAPEAEDIILGFTGGA